MSTDHHALQGSKFPNTPAGSSEQNVPRLVFLDASFLSALFALEPQCYPNPWSRNLIRGEFAKEISFRLGLVVDDELSAYTFCHAYCDQLHILNFAVAPAMRRRGAGKLLMANVLRHAVNQGTGLALLEVRPSNLAALHLYARFGFQRVGVRKNYYRNDGEDALLLERTLSWSDVNDFDWISYAAVEQFRRSAPPQAAPQGRIMA